MLYSIHMVCHRRMTVGYLIELLAGKVGCIEWKVIDGTSFSGTSKKELEEQLEDLGFRYDGKETMYNGVTGKRIRCKDFCWKYVLS